MANVFGSRDERKVEEEEEMAVKQKKIRKNLGKEWWVDNPRPIEREWAGESECGARGWWREHREMRLPEMALRTETLYATGKRKGGMKIYGDSPPQHEGSLIASLPLHKSSATDSASVFSRVLFIRLFLLQYLDVSLGDCYKSRQNTDKTRIKY